MGINAHISNLLYMVTKIGYFILKTRHAFAVWMRYKRKVTFFIENGSLLCFVNFVLDSQRIFLIFVR